MPPLHCLHNGTPSRDLQTGNGSPSALSINPTIFLRQSRREMDSRTVHTSNDDLFHGCYTPSLHRKSNNVHLRSSAQPPNCLPDKTVSVFRKQITFLAALPAPRRPSSPPASWWSGFWRAVARPSAPPVFPARFPFPDSSVPPTQSMEFPSAAA